MCQIIPIESLRDPRARVLNKIAIRLRVHIDAYVLDRRLDGYDVEEYIYRVCEQLDQRNDLGDLKSLHLALIEEPAIPRLERMFDRLFSD